jgi:sugar lactone lactonase YvrE
MPLARSDDNVRIILDCQDHAGESVVWDAARQRLVWVDIGNKRIHRLDPETGHHETWTTPEFVTSIGLRDDGGAVVGLARRIALWSFGSAFETFAEPENDHPDNRFNEGKVGPDGCFWVGSMQNNLRDDGSERDVRGRHGALHRIERNGRFVRLTPHHIGISNTMAWTSDSRFLFGDTLENVIYQNDWDSASNTIANRRPFFAGFPRGLPDGSCLDAEGYLWNCGDVGGACVVRVAPDGKVDRVLELPCSWPTSCAFGGPNLDTLYVTSARFALSSADLAARPHEGALLAVDTRVRGSMRISLAEVVSDKQSQIHLNEASRGSHRCG